LDDIWGRLNEMEAMANEILAKCARIRAQIITIKQGAGLDSPKVP